MVLSVYTNLRISNCIEETFIIIHQPLSCCADSGVPQGSLNSIIYCFLKGCTFSGKKDLDLHNTESHHGRVILFSVLLNPSDYVKQKVSMWCQGVFTTSQDLTKGLGLQLTALASNNLKRDLTRYFIFLCILFVQLPSMHGN